MVTVVTGSLKITLTNLGTGKAISENVSGPGNLTTHPDGSVTSRGKGRSVIFLSPADAKRFGLPGVTAVAGALTTSFAPDGTITSLSLRGHVLLDVCAAIG